MLVNAFKYLRYVLLLIGVGILALGIRGCIKDRQPPQDFNVPLGENVSAQIVTDNRHVAVRTQKGTKAGYVPDGGEAVIQINHGGDIKLNISTIGFTLRPVVGNFVSDKVYVAYGLQVGYWNRFELYIAGTYPSPALLGGLGYRLDQFKLYNTSVYVGGTSRKDIGGGLLLRF